jgi:polysaccharide biosynthesis/export protein
LQRALARHTFAAMETIKRVSFLALVASLASCKHAGEYVWVDQYGSAKAADSAYALAPGDLVAVRVMGHDDLSTRGKVRADGRISVPYLDDVQVAGQAPSQIAEKLRRDLVQFVAHPVVTVTVDEPHPFTVPVTGEVTRPGVYALDSPAGVLQALASAGGLTQFAHPDHIYVLRSAPEAAGPVRIRFRYDWLAHAEGRSGTFQLQRNDIVVVE